MGGSARLYIDYLDGFWCDKMVRLFKARRHGEGVQEPGIESLCDLEALRSAYLEELSQLTPDQLRSAAQDAMHEQDQGRPFNDIGTEADYQHFGRCAYLTVPEAVALSLGKDPRVVHWDIIRPYLGVSTFAYNYASRLDLLERAVAWGELPERFSPLEFLTWAHRYKVSVPEALIQCTFARGEPIRYWHDLCLDQSSEIAVLKRELEATRNALRDLQEEMEQEAQRTFGEWLDGQAELDRQQQKFAEEAAAMQVVQAQVLEENCRLREQITLVAERDQAEILGTTERKSLLTIVIAAAVDGYGYNPSITKNDCTSLIADAATRLGLKMTGETVLKYLKMATLLNDFVCPDTPPRKPKSAKRKTKSV